MFYELPICFDTIVSILKKSVYNMSLVSIIGHFVKLLQYFFFNFHLIHFQSSALESSKHFIFPLL